MEVFVYYYQTLGRGRDEIEDEITAKLADFDCEVTGSGAGSSGGNFDLVLADETPLSEVVSAIAKALREIGFPDSTKICAEEIQMLLGDAN